MAGVHLKSHCEVEEGIKHFQNKANESVNWNNISEEHFVSIHQKPCKLFVPVNHLMESVKRK